MAARRVQHDRYGKPLPTLAQATPQPDTSARPSNVERRNRFLALLCATMDEHYPALLRQDVRAKVSITFTVLDGMIEDDFDVVIARKYRKHSQGWDYHPRNEED